jgi:hypothetical protein
MFTLKFLAHDQKSHEVFQCERYSVNSVPTDDSFPEGTSVIRMYRTLDDDNPYYVTLGPKEWYGVTYVMNEAGKTIDTLR